MTYTLQPFPDTCGKRIKADGEPEFSNHVELTLNLTIYTLSPSVDACGIFFKHRDAGVREDTEIFSLVPVESVRENGNADLTG
jgi:hypothetical protein